MRGFGQRSSRERRREKDVAENRRWLHTRLLSYCVAVAAVACGGDKATGPAPCDTYTGGVIGSATDRKSTRLNSSHITISYAVFCLKKKKKKKKKIKQHKKNNKKTTKI